MTSDNICHIKSSAVSIVGPRLNQRVESSESGKPNADHLDSFHSRSRNNRVEERCVKSYPPGMPSRGPRDHRGIGRRGGNLSPKRRAAFPFAIGGELSAISLRRRFVNASREFCCTAINEETDLEKLAREVAFRPARQTDPGKLAREVDVRPARDNALVPDQKERSDDVLAV
jgi:hypothetical protein